MHALRNAHQELMELMENVNNVTQLVLVVPTVQSIHANPALKVSYIQMEIHAHLIVPPDNIQQTVNAKPVIHLVKNVLVPINVLHVLVNYYCKELNANKTVTMDISALKVYANNVQLDAHNAHH